MPLIFRYFWVIAIVVTFVNGASAWRKAQPDIDKHPEKASGYRRLVIGWMFWGNLGWVVMGAGMLIGGVPDILVYLHVPRNPWVIAWYVTNIAVSLLGILWIFRGGAEKLAAHPVFLRHGGEDARAIRFYAVLSLAVGIVFLVVLYLDVIPIPAAGVPLL